MAAQDRGPELVAVGGLMLAISMIFTMMRFYSRAIIVKQVGSDDYLAFGAQLCFTWMCISVFIDVKYGMGKKTADIPNTFENAPTAILWWWLAELFYLMAGMLLKLSMGIFLLRIATQRRIRIVIWCIIACSVIGTGYILLQFIFQCWPVNYFWKQYDIFGNPKGKCLSRDFTTNCAYAYSAITCAVDFALCIVPLFMVAKLQLNRRTKLSVMAVLSLWCLASITTFIRIPYLPGLNGDLSDFLYVTSDLAIWSICEVGISITCIATATLRPLMHRSFFRGSSDASHSHTVSGGGTFDHSSSRSRSGWPSGNGGIGTPRQVGYMRPNNRKRPMTIDEEVGMARGGSNSSLEELEMKTPGLAVTREHGGHSYSRSDTERRVQMDRGRQLAMGTTTYVRGGDESVNGREGEQNADFVYGYGIRRTTVVTTQRD